MYVDAKHIGDYVFVSERLEDGKRRVRTHPAPYEFFYEDPNGKHLSMFETALSKRTFGKRYAFNESIEQAKKDGLRLFESDVRPEYKLLERVHRDETPVQLNISMFDIEVESDPEAGFADYENPWGRINGITVYNKWEDKRYTLILCPPGKTHDQCVKEVSGLGAKVFDDEADLLGYFLACIEDADVLSGWNSEFFDLPYIIQRIRVVLGGEDWTEIGDFSDGFWPSDESKIWLSALCLFDQIPKMRLVDNYGKKEPVFDLCGRVHLDYMALYRSFVPKQQTSYSLGYILEKEINETKVEYVGSLQDLWLKDTRKFTEYNIQDVMGMSRMDDKLKYITQASDVTHVACVNIREATGSVTKIEHALMVELHRLGRKAPDKPPGGVSTKVAGAFVFQPPRDQIGWLFSLDVKSLYPSIIRMLNIGPETVIGQFDVTRTMNELDRLVREGIAKDRTEAWHHFTGVWEYHEIIDEKDNDLTLVLESGERLTAPAKEWKLALAEAGWCVTANGTVFDLSKQSLIAQCLTKWYFERVEFQNKKKAAAKAGNTEESEYWDRVQATRKIFLNATYGALLNAWFRFNDPRFGQSVTLSGRVVTKHMIRKGNELLGDGYQFGKHCVYGDTDSAYLSAEELVATMFKHLSHDQDKLLDELVPYVNAVSDKVNDSFPPVMGGAFLVGEERGRLIECNREVVGRNGLWKLKGKKLYAIGVVDEEGKRVRKAKIMGMLRSDAPDYVQKFLKDMMDKVLFDSWNYSQVRAEVDKLRDSLWTADCRMLGKPVRASKVSIGDRDRKEWIDGGMRGPKPRIHYAVMAALNFNDYRLYHNDLVTPKIGNGEKVLVFDLLTDPIRNPKGFESIALSTNVTTVPDWFKNLPFDVRASQFSIIQAKAENMFEMLEWEFPVQTNAADEVFGY